LQHAESSVKRTQQQLQQHSHSESVMLEAAKRQAQQALQETHATFKQVQRMAAAKMRPALQRVHQRFLAQTRHLTATCPATWANREFVLTQFLAAVNRFFKNKDQPPKQKSGAPEEVHFYHRFTSGGLPVDRVFGRGQRLHIEPVPSTAYDPMLPQQRQKRLARTTGTFQVGPVALPFHTILHRSLPQGGYLKAAALVGKKVVREGYHHRHNGGHVIPARWEWALHLTLEIPPREKLPQERDNLTATVQLSCGQWSDEQMEIGRLVDSTGHQEILYFPQEILEAWQYKRELQRRTDQVLEETKRHLQNLTHRDGLPPQAQRTIAHVNAMGRTGLWRLLRCLEEAYAVGDALEIVRHWADRSTRLRREARGLEQRYLRHRDWCYRNLAVQWCQRYQHLMVTAPNLRTSSWRSQKGDSPSLQEMAQYRHLMSLSRFLTFLRETAAKTGTEIVIKKAESPFILHGAPDLREQA
jgi:hypothetical protein